MPKYPGDDASEEKRAEYNEQSELYNNSINAADDYTNEIIYGNFFLDSNTGIALPPKDDDDTDKPSENSDLDETDNSLNLEYEQIIYDPENINNAYLEAIAGCDNPTLGIERVLRTYDEEQ